MAYSVVRFVEDLVVAMCPTKKVTFRGEGSVTAPFKGANYSAILLQQGSKEDMDLLLQRIRKSDEFFEKFVKANATCQETRTESRQEIKVQRNEQLKSSVTDASTQCRRIQLTTVSLEQLNVFNEHEKSHPTTTTVPTKDEVTPDEPNDPCPMLLSPPLLEYSDDFVQNPSNKRLVRRNLLRDTFTSDEFCEKCIRVNMTCQETQTESCQEINDQRNEQLKSSAANASSQSTKDHLSTVSLEQLNVLNENEQSDPITTTALTKDAVIPDEPYDRSPLTSSPPTPESSGDFVQKPSNKRLVVRNLFRDNSTSNDRTESEEGVRPLQAKASRKKNHVKRNVREKSSHNDSSESDEGVGPPQPKTTRKKHACFFCYGEFVRIRMHLQRKHADEPKMIAIRGSRDNVEKKKKLSELIKMGDFNYNLKVITSKKGKLIVSREEEGAKPTDYIPCPDCLGFYKKSLLWKHARVCSKTSRTEDSHRRVIQESAALINRFVNPSINEDFKKCILSSMRLDEEGSIVRADQTILKFGLDLFENHGSNQSEMIRQNMRQLARLVLSMTKLGGTSTKLIDIITPSSIESILEGVRALCEEERSTTSKPTFGKPSLALKIGYHLRACASLLRAEALGRGDVEEAKKLKTFVSLLDCKYTKKISSGALFSLRHKKRNAVECLPITNDLMKLTSFVATEIPTRLRTLRKCVDPGNWSRLANVVLTRIILFNKRRGGETSKMLVTDYLEKKNWDQSVKSAEIEKSLSEFEKKIASKLQLLKIVGKKGLRAVPVLLTNDVIDAMETLHATRLKAGISVTNEYFFAQPSPKGIKNSYIRGVDALRKTITECDGIENPHDITSTKLRKYIATVVQVLNIKENEVDWLARHLGHDVRVHRDFYRLQDNAVEMAKVSSLLVAVEQGQVGNFAGKSLDDISLEEVPLFQEDDEEDELRNEGESHSSQKAALASIEDNIEPKPTTSTDQGRQKRLRESYEDRDWMPELELTPINKKSRTIKNSRNKSKENTKELGPKTRKQIHRPWPTPAKSYMIDYFRSPIKYGVVPGKEAIEQCINAKPHLFESRSWLDVKNYAKNYIYKLKALRQKK